jgi:hypothetical protein
MNRKLIKRRLKTFLGLEFHPSIEVKKTKVRLGSDYGGWDVVLDGITKDSVVYSFGIGDDASFDLELIDRYNLVIHAFDPTPKSK